MNKLQNSKQQKTQNSKQNPKYVIGKFPLWKMKQKTQNCSNSNSYLPSSPINIFNGFQNKNTNKRTNKLQTTKTGNQNKNTKTDLMGSTAYWNLMGTKIETRTLWNNHKPQAISKKYRSRERSAYLRRRAPLPATSIEHRRRRLCLRRLHHLREVPPLQAP